jgi:hypothetical protein
MGNAKEFNKKVKVFFSCGTESPPENPDALKNHQRELIATGISDSYLYISPGTSHEWQIQRRSLYTFAPLLFQSARSTCSARARHHAEVVAATRSVQPDTMGRHEEIEWIDAASLFHNDATQVDQSSCNRATLVRYVILSREMAVLQAVNASFQRGQGEAAGQYSVFHLASCTFERYNMDICRSRRVHPTRRTTRKLDLRRVSNRIVMDSRSDCWSLALFAVINPLLQIVWVSG